MNKSIGSLGILFHDPATVLLYRLYSGQSPRCLARLTVGQFNLMRMCERYGPGRYVVCVKHHGAWIQQRCRITGGRLIRTRQWTVRWG